MDTKFNEFCKKYLLKLKNDKDIEEVELDLYQDYRERISFYITEFSYTPNSHYLGENGSISFSLDKEDLKYFYDKYSKKLEDEMNKNIEQIKQMYE